MHADIGQLWAHAVWADRLVLDALPEDPAAAPSALREFAHVVGAEETWLARLEGRDARAAVWPSLTLPEVRDLMADTHAGYATFLEGEAGRDPSRTIAYRNSAGLDFTSTVRDVLLHVCLHGQYHRGKVNALLRAAGLAPAPADYIAFVRGVPSATEATSRRKP